MDSVSEVSLSLSVVGIPRDDEACKSSFSFQPPAYVAGRSIQLLPLPSPGQSRQAMFRSSWPWCFVREVSRGSETRQEFRSLATAESPGDVRYWVHSKIRVWQRTRTILV